MTELFEATDGQVPLDADEREGLIPAHIATRAQLNEWELANIAVGQGNGRWARVAADLLLRALGRESFTWGSRNLADINETRRRYIDAVRAADAGNPGPLIEFARS